MANKITLHATALSERQWYVFPEGHDLSEYDSEGITVWEFTNQLEPNTGTKIKTRTTITEFGLPRDPLTGKVDETAYALCYDIAFGVVHCSQYRRGPYMPGQEQTWSDAVNKPKREDFESLDKDGNLLRHYVYRSETPATRDIILAKLDALKKSRDEKMEIQNPTSREGTDGSGLQEP